MNNLLRLVGTKYPIIQAPMAGSDNARMVAAASEAGALGSLGGQYRKPDELRAAIREIRSLTDKPFAVNLFALPPLTPPSADEIEAALQNWIRTMHACEHRSPQSLTCKIRSMRKSN
jgi:nitronate monooxygenase